MSAVVPVFGSTEMKKALISKKYREVFSSVPLFSFLSTQSTLIFSHLLAPNKLIFTWEEAPIFTEYLLYV